MHEVICPTCGAINQADAEVCWRCLASMADAPAPANAPGRADDERAPDETGATTNTSAAKA